jgi:GT2 family glycosyltransferase
MIRAAPALAVGQRRRPVKAPVRVVDLELEDPLSRAAPSAVRMPSSDSSVRLLVRLHGHTLGVIDLSEAELRSEELRAIVWTELGEAIGRHFRLHHQLTVDAVPLAGFGVGDRKSCCWQAAISASLPRVEIVINTCSASEQLTRAVGSAVAQDYPNFRVTVVDNRPATSAVRTLLAQRFGDKPNVVYVKESKPGLGPARNAGLSASSSDIVAFTDDDVVLDPSWLGWLVAGFEAADRVACVTGLIVPLELESAAQLLLEEFSGFSKGYERLIWDLEDHRLRHPLYPYTVGIFGSGASCAFRRSVLVAMGGFDQHLGIGTPAVGGEDLDVFVRIVLGGGQIVYEPASLLRHSHRRDMPALERQVRGYGTGLTAMLTKHVLSNRATRKAVLRRIPAGITYAFSPHSPKNLRKQAGFSLRLSLLEWAGMAYGPIGYLRSRMTG